MILQTIRTNDTCVEYYEDDSTAPFVTSYPVGYSTMAQYANGHYRDVDDFILPKKSKPHHVRRKKGWER